MLLFTIFSIDNVKADGTCVGDGCTTGEEGQDYNAIDKDGLGSGHGSCPNGLCAYNNGNEMAVEVKIAYVDNTGMDTYHTEVWTNNPSASGTITANGNRMVYKDFLPSGGSNYTGMGEAISAYFMGNNGANANSWYNAYADTSLATQNSSAINNAQYGTRIITTPVLSFIDHGKGNSYLTVKEVAARYNELTNKARFESIAKLFMTEYNDVGIMKGGLLNPLLVANLFSGYGYNIIDFMKYLGIKPTTVKAQPSCPGGSMSLNNPSANCTESLGGNTYSYSYTASGGSKASVHRQYGEDQNASGTGAYCKLYCQEYGTAVLPGALGTSVQLGSYIVWPTATTNETTKFTENMYPLKFSGRKECKLVLMPDKGNFPGQGCLQDPVAEYECLYDGTKVSGSKFACHISRSESISVVGTKKDHFNYTYEQARISNGQYFNKEGYCGTPAYVEGQATCPEGTWSKYKLDPIGNTHYNEAVYGKYNQLVKGISDQAEATASACRTEIALRPCQKLPYYQEECTAHDDKGFCTRTEMRPTCHFDYDNAVKAYAAAQAAYKGLESEIKEVKSNVTTCKSYIKNFNWARDILHEIGLCGNFSANASDYYHFSSTASFNYNSCGGEYSVGGNLNKENDVSYSCQGQCGGLGFELKPNYLTLRSLDTSSKLDGKVSQIQGRNINFVTNEVKYTTNSDYSYVDKKKNKYSKFKLNTNYIGIDNLKGGLAKVLPTDYSCNINDSSGNAISYDLEITNTSFGENNKFKVKGNSGDNYVCKYTVSKKNDGCECPQDTNMAGSDLMYYVKNDPISCADAQAKYCSGFTPQECKDCYYCPDGSNPVPMAACLKTGVGYAKCVSQVCGSEYKCKNTNGLRTGMDITDCVQTRIMQGQSVNEALNYCDSVICPIGKFIIYRTIKLENPFPGKEISKVAPGFNNDVVGRYPGTNWNGKILVNNKIRNNRSTSGTTIYNKREPLYTFVLTGTRIEALREYNKKQKDGYNDFTLECKKNNSSGCISYNVVHNNSLSGLSGGTCQNISLDNGFYTCDD